MPLPLALATDMTPSMRSELRWEVAGVAIGFVLVSVGLAAMVLFLFRRRSSELTLTYFRSFAVLYSVRLLFWQSIIRSLFPVGRAVFDHIELRHWSAAEGLQRTQDDDIMLLVLDFLPSP